MSSIKLSKEQLAFIKEHYAVIENNGKRYAVSPFILEAHKNGEITLLNIDEITPELKDFISKASPIMGLF